MCPGECGFTLVIVGARDLKNVSTLGKLDPYVRIIYGKDEYKTSIIKDGGCSPIWNYEMSLKGKAPILRVEVYDSHIFKDKMIGYTEISIQSLPYGTQNLAFNLHCSKYAGEATGVLLTKISVFPSTRVYANSCTPYRYPSGFPPEDGPIYPCVTQSCLPRFSSYPPVQQSLPAFFTRPVTPPKVTHTSVFPTMPDFVVPAQLERRSSYEQARQYGDYTTNRPHVTASMFPIIPSY